MFTLELQYKRIMFLDNGPTITSASLTETLTLSFCMSSSVNRNRGPTMDSRAPCSVDWSKLPDELWFRIGQQLKPFIERLRFRSVSYSWRHSIPRFHPSIPPEFPYPFSFHSKASLARTTLYLLRTNPFPYASTSSSSSPKDYWLRKLEEDFFPEALKLCKL